VIDFDVVTLSRANDGARLGRAQFCPAYGLRGIHPSISLV
jgi:hypothetical protein